MSQTSQFGPPNQPSGGGNTVLWVLLIVGLLVLLVCGGLCAGCIVIGRQAGQAIGEGLQELALLGPYFQTQLAVQSDDRVRQRLGEDLEFAEYTRQAAGPPQATGETFQFEVTGPLGTGIVSAVATGQGGNWRVSKITVTFEDGSSIDVDPPEPGEFGAGDFSDPNFGDQPSFGDQPNFDFSAPEPETTTQP